MQAVDPMAVVVDWFDAYRASDLLALVALYDAAANINCTCQGREITIGGAGAVRAYWADRLHSQPFIELEDIQPSEGSIALLYQTELGIIRTVMTINDAGKIMSTGCCLQGFEERSGSCCAT
jgi:hypothetical protein